MKTMKKLLPYLKPFRKQCIIGPICKLLEAILEILLPTIMAFMINHGVLTQDRDVVFTYGGLMIAMVFIGFAFSLTCQYHAAIASQGFGTNMRNLLFQKIMKFSFDEIDALGRSTYINRITYDVNQLQLAVAMLIRLVIRAPFICIGAIVMAMLLDFQLALILLGTTPFIILTLYIFMKLTTPLYKKIQKQLDHFINILEQNFSGVRVIRAFLSQHHEVDCLSQDNKELQQLSLKVARYSALLNPMTALIVNGAIILLLYSGILSTTSLPIEAGTLVAFINYATQILMAILATSNLIVIFTKASASAQRVNEILDMTTSMEDGKEECTVDDTVAVSLNHMDFQYPRSKKKTLFDIDLKIMANERIGIIGGTGSGKSTLATVLCRFYDDDHIELFGRKIKQYSAHSLRSLITIIPQQNELFSGTLRMNLQFGKQDASDDEIWEALRIAQAYDFVKAMPDALDTLIQAKGNNLSGGQRQRICIARGILANSRILIFDDSFSALDFKTDIDLRKALNQLEQTQILISQRVSTLSSCDRILVLHGGHMADFSTHEHLLETCAIYQEIYASQQSGLEVAS